MSTETDMADTLKSIWQLGYDEAAGEIGTTYDNDPESPRSQAYDNGRTAGRIALGWEDA